MEAPGTQHVTAHGAGAQARLGRRANVDRLTDVVKVNWEMVSKEDRRVLAAQDRSGPIVPDFQRPRLFLR
jgi:hypothetical protein